MGNSNSGIIIAFFLNGIGIDKFGVCYQKKFDPQINLPFSFLIRKYFFHDNPTWNINCSGVDIPTRYSEYLLQPVNGVGKKWN